METDVLRQKLEAHCAQRDCCTAEVLKKLLLLGAREATAEDIILHLKTNKFLDDRRYSLNFVRKAFSGKQKGREWIQAELTIREIDETIIAEALQVLSDEDFSALLQSKIKKEVQHLSPEEIPLNTPRIIRKLVRDGFEEEDILSIFRKQFNIEI